MAREPNAAQAIYGHLPQGTPDVAQRRDDPPASVAAAMYPRPQPQPINPYREILLRNLRELRQRIDERMRREGKLPPSK